MGALALRNTAEMILLLECGLLVLVIRRGRWKQQ
jgi:hypothetical protein